MQTLGRRPSLMPSFQRRAWTIVIPLAIRATVFLLFVHSPQSR